MRPGPDAAPTTAALAALEVRAGAAKLAPDSIVAALAALPGWSVDDGALRKAYRFADWRATMAFVNAVAGMADRVDHHPELNVAWGRCTVAWRTHDADGITQNDLTCAARTDALDRPGGAAEGTG
jgi:4a-hydroxytetrahydrobiopterin dehydratase